MPQTLFKIPEKGNKALQDLIICLIFVSIILILAIILEAGEDVADWSLNIEKEFAGFELPEIFGVFLVFIVATTFFALRRWREVVREFHQRRLLEEELLMEKEQMAITLTSIGDAVIATDITGKITLLNTVAETLTGWLAVDSVNRPLPEIFNIINEYTRKAVENPVAKVLNSGKIVGLANHTILIAKDGREVAIADSAAPIRDLHGNVHGVIMVFRDVSGKRQQERELQESEEKFRELFNSANDAIFLLEISAEGTPQKFQEVNDVACKRLGFPKEELLTKSLTEIEDLRGTSARWQNLMKNGGRVTYETIHRSKTGMLIPVEVSAHVFNFKGSKLMLSIARDITERKEVDEKLRFLGLHDSLTRLYNRAFFETEMQRLNETRFAPQGIIMCDIDGLKLVNDTMGHNHGDTLLMAAVEVIKSAVDQETIIARVGGDEFAVLLANTSRSILEEICENIKKEVNNYNKLHPQLPLSFSTGFAISCPGLLNMSEIFKEADKNMYREKLYRSQSVHSAIVQTLMKALEARDFITEGHAESLQYLIGRISVLLGLPENGRTELRLLAQFHDIGKVGIPDRILFKSGPLTHEETLEMRRHCEIGHRIALSAPDLVPIAGWILKHHEWWNGEGYPLGLSGPEIPLECRILAIVDAYDAMISDRPYRKAMLPQKALEELQRCAGSQFDPNLVPKFIKILEENGR